MPSASQFLFLTVLSFLFVHELDAIRQHEWRFFFAPVPVRDATAYRLFTGLHAPLFIVILWFFQSPVFQLGMDAFVILHGFVHHLLRNHPLIAFESWFSRLWIYGGAALAALHLAVSL